MPVDANASGTNDKSETPSLAGGKQDETLYVLQVMISTATETFHKKLHPPHALDNARIVGHVLASFFLVCRSGRWLGLNRRRGSPIPDAACGAGTAPIHERQMVPADVSLDCVVIASVRRRAGRPVEVTDIPGRQLALAILKGADACSIHHDHGHTHELTVARMHPRPTGEGVAHVQRGKLDRQQVAKGA